MSAEENTGKSFNHIFHEEQTIDAKTESRIVKNIIKRSIVNVEHCNDHIKLYPDLHLINEFVYLIDDGKSATTRVILDEQDLYLDTKSFREMNSAELAKIQSDTLSTIHEKLTSNYKNNINYSRLQGLHWRIPKNANSAKKDNAKYAALVCEVNVEIKFENGGRWIRQFVY